MGSPPHPRVRLAFACVNASGTALAFSRLRSCPASGPWDRIQTPPRLQCRGSARARLPPIESKGVGAARGEVGWVVLPLRRPKGPGRGLWVWLRMLGAGSRGPPFAPAATPPRAAQSIKQASSQAHGRRVWPPCAVLRLVLNRCGAEHTARGDQAAGWTEEARAPRGRRRSKP
ncbi:MAG: hypothetical protein J3K34DRAFT_46224 [Monoraphidium minutum]|nr:MAG: hypothetical protein J3K34DRAFT_46224 [Monoraphidium minutum]